MGHCRADFGQMLKQFGPMLDQIWVNFLMFGSFPALEAPEWPHLYKWDDLGRVGRRARGPHLDKGGGLGRFGAVLGQTWALLGTQNGVQNRPKTIPKRG